MQIEDIAQFNFDDLYDPFRKEQAYSTLKAYAIRRIRESGQPVGLVPFEDFEAWCEDNGHSPLPTTAEALAGYLLHSVAIGTLEKHHARARAVQIAQFHDKTRRPPTTLLNQAMQRFVNAS